MGSPELLTALQWFVFFKLVFVTIFLLPVGTLQLLQTGFFLRLVTSHRRTLLFCRIGFRVCPESHNRNITNLYIFLFFTGKLCVTNLYSQSLEPILKPPGGGDRYFELQAILLLHLILSSSSWTKHKKFWRFFAFGVQHNVLNFWMVLKAHEQASIKQVYAVFRYAQTDHECSKRALRVWPVQMQLLHLK